LAEQYLPEYAVIDLAVSVTNQSGTGKKTDFLDAIPLRHADRFRQYCDGSRGD